MIFFRANEYAVSEKNEGVHYVTVFTSRDTIVGLLMECGLYALHAPAVARIFTTVMLTFNQVR
jgi:hypothetical protein